MKNQRKKQQRLAIVFLKDVQSASQPKFDRLSKVLEEYENSRLDSAGALRMLLQELGSESRLVARVNDLLDDEHKIRFISVQESINMITRIFEVMGQAVSEQENEKYIRFLSVVTNTSKRFDNSPTISLEEFASTIVEDVVADMPEAYWGPQFVDNLRQAIEESTKTLKKAENGVNGGSHQSATGNDRAAPEPRLVNKPSSSDPGQAKPKAKPHPSTQGSNGAHQVQGAPQLQPAVSQHDPSPQLTAEESQQFNLRVESEVILALKSKVPPPAFHGFVKTLALFSVSVISFQELVTLNQETLLMVDKEICQALRELVESRAVPIHKKSTFNIKLANIESGDPGHNRKYFRIVSPIFGGDKANNSLINKTYVAITSGHESAGPQEETAVSRTPKNLCEIALFKVEDEMHEVDSSLVQFRMTVAMIDRIVGGKLGEEAVAKLCQKISCIRTVHHLYGVKAGQVIEELKRRQRQVLETVRYRMAQRIQFLEAKRRELRDGSWTVRMSGNYYKALDIRSNNLKVQEKAMINNKSLVEQLKGVVPGGPLARSWLSRQLDQRPEGLLGKFGVSPEGAYCWNPAFCASLADTDLLADAFSLARVYVKLSKNNNPEKTKINSFLDRVVANFLGIPRPAAFAVQPVSPDELAAALSDIERLLCPSKEFFFCDKVTLKVNPEAFKAMQEFNLSSTEESESKEDRKSSQSKARVADTGPAGHSQASPEVAPSDTPQSDHDEMELEEDSIVSRQFKELINSKKWEKEAKEMTVEQVGFDPSRRHFYSSYHFYAVYQYFFMLYERLNFAYSFAVESSAGIRLYEVFRRLLFMGLFGVIDETGFEDGVRMMFGSNGGVLLNFERILAALLKAVPSDDFSNFVIELSPQLFGEKVVSLVPPEPVVFAKTCFKLNEMTSKDAKGAKANHFLAFNNTCSLSGNELVKFEFDARTGLFLVHKVKSLFSEGKKAVGGSLAAVEAQYSLLSWPVKALVRKGGKLKKQVANNLTYGWDVRRRMLEVRSGQFDDLLQVSRPAIPIETRRHRINKVQKHSRFREILANFHP